jgi:predicted DNA-binding transcriptional regulator AlpA
MHAGDGVMLDYKAVCKAAGFDKRALYREMAAGRFPRPKKLGVKRVRWRATDVAAKLGVSVEALLLLARGGDGPGPGNAVSSPPHVVAAAPDTDTPDTDTPATSLAAARACVYCAWEAAQAVHAFAPDWPDTDPAWTDILRTGTADNLADLRDALTAAYRHLPPAMPALTRVAPDHSPSVPLPADPATGLGPRSLASPTAHGLAWRLALYVLNRVWRATDPEGYRAAMTTPGGPLAVLEMFDPEATADGLGDVWRELALALPEINRDTLDAALRGEAARAGLPGAMVSGHARERRPSGRLDWRERAALSELCDIHGGASRSETIHLAIVGRRRAVEAEIGPARFAAMVAKAREAERGTNLPPTCRVLHKP